jgi:GntR family transcriptional repressor for pyruvate dehydrogenase complex
MPSAEANLQRSHASESIDAASQRALSGLRALLAQHAAFPDRPLPPERDLATDFGVGRGSIRRALSILEAEGRIWRRQGKGTFAGPARPSAAPTFAALASRTNFIEVMEARLHLEPSLAALAATRASAEQLAMLRRLVKETKQRQRAAAEDPDGLELWDGALHRGIAEAAGNRLLLDIFELIDTIRVDPAWRTLRQRARTLDLLHGYSQDHDAIVRAIEERDPAAAATAMRGHLRTLQQALDTVIHQDLGAPA